MKIRNASNEKFDIIIVAGQSNALGCGNGKTKTPWVPNENIVMFNERFTAEFITTTYGDLLEIETTGDCYLTIADEREENGEKRGVFALAFAKKYVENNLEKGRKLLLVQTAIGGTGFARGHWGENERLEKRMFEMVDSALSMNKENRIVGVLWHQGEHDIFRNADFDYDERYSYYKQKLTNLLLRIRAKYGEVPFVSGSFCKGWISEQKVENVKAIKDVYSYVLSTYDKVNHVWNTDDLKSNSEMVEGNGDNIHFSRDACYELGRRYYEKFNEIM